jgi:hypothetical protein
VGSSDAAHTSAGDVFAPLRFTAFELDVVRPWRTDGGYGLEYQGRVVPLAVMQQNPTQPAVRSRRGWLLSTSTSRGSAYGFGVKPAGLRGWLALGDRFRLEADVAAGVMWFDAPLLAANASRFNFAYEFGLGLRAMRTAGPGLTIGYRRHHVSNGGIGEVNPGLNSNLIFLGIPVF